MDDPSRREGRRLALWTVLRTALTTAFLLAAYFVAPLNRAFTVLSGVVLGAVLAVLAVVVWWQARAIVRHPAPRLRAVEALMTSAALFLVAFSTSYCLMGNGVSSEFSERLTHVDALYFTMTVFSSVGFGDIVPVSQAARVLTTVQMVGDLVFLGLAAKVFLEAMRRGVERREGR
ncbi:two pore domain potassium channel family protein [Actinomadura sp. NAK00032]|uniref:potassium channel family protein n=1 Tax=Actinomadura sp. NAK00032 TaxID=2742128 RepID=UPI00158FF89A|nr:potassium channel family protein [Actinomadura sp. NAK00032]QKW33085.1 two pore domain potassium channel family protein [Actinomadura sp. NAK00032]